MNRRVPGNASLAAFPTVVLVAVLLALTAGTTSPAATGQPPVRPQGNAPVRFSQFDAWPRVLERVDAEPVLGVYQNSVWADVTITAAGSVESVKPLRGNPAHFKSASAALMRWRFKPFTFNGQPVRAVVELNILVPDQKPDAVQVANKAAGDMTRKCLALVGDGNPIEAETACLAAVEAARSLKGEESFDVQALESALGLALFTQGRARDALGHFERALAIGQKRGASPDLAAVYRFVGGAQAKLGELTKADDAYRRAIETLEAAAAANPSLGALYGTPLQTLLVEHASVKRTLGEFGAAADLEKKARNIEVTGRPPMLDVMKSGPDVTIRNRGSETLELLSVSTSDRCEFRYYDAAVRGDTSERERRGRWWSIDTKDQQLETPRESTVTLKPGATTEVYLLTGGKGCSDPVSLDVQTRQGVLNHTFRPAK